MSQLAFFVNSDACSGCKTCQVACKDRNDLPAGLHWRRVYEVTAAGGRRAATPGRTRSRPTTCRSPATTARTRCAGSSARWTPSGSGRTASCSSTRRAASSATSAGSDCPYEAIRYEAATNAVSKCDFCVDEIDAGRPPACVAACPNRALDFGDLDDLRRRFGPVDRVFPLEDPAASRPAVVIKPHRHATPCRATSRKWQTGRNCERDRARLEAEADRRAPTGTQRKQREARRAVSRSHVPERQLRVAVALVPARGRAARASARRCRSSCGRCRTRSRGS